MKNIDPFYLKKDGSVSYRFVYRNKDISDKQLTKTISFKQKPSQRILEKEYWQWREKIDNEIVRKESPNTSDILNLYLKQRKKYAEKYKDAINIVRPIIANFRDIKKIKKSDCYQVWEYLKDAKRKESTAKRYYNIFSAFLSWCSNMDYIEYNPSLNLNFKVKQSKREGVLTTAQKREVLEKSKPLPHLHLTLLFAMLSGLRIGEILNMKWSWIDFENKTLRIPSENTKNKKGFYTTLSSKLIDILKKERLKNKETIYVIEYQGKPCLRIKNSFSRLRKQLSFEYIGNGERFTFHHLRHTFATELAQSGLPLVEVKNALNHSNIQTTLRYAHSTGKGVTDAIDKMNEDLF